MRVVVHDYGGYPFVLELSRALADRHEVLHLHGGGIRPSRADMSRRPTDPPSLRIEAVPIHEPLVSRAGLSRLLQERRYGRVLANKIRDFAPDSVLSVPSSLDAQAAALAVAREVGAGFTFWLQDLYGQAMERLLGRRAALVGRVIASRFSRLERRLLQRSDAVVAITHDFLRILHEWKVDDGRVSVIPNWAPLDQIEPLPKVNAWSKQHGLADTPVLLYAGTLGRKHDPQLLLALAAGLPQANVVVVSEGAGTDLLRRNTTAPNLQILPLQPPKQLGEVLASADVLVAVLDADANIFSVPSKVLTYLAAGRPILAAIPEANLAARTIEEAGAGVVVEPDDTDAFVAAARSLMTDAAARDAAGARGRAYAERMFDIGPIADRFDSILEGSRRHTAGAAHGTRTEARS
jgi:colanic acid biosynthesis glycosyl transferase WcaI